MYTHLNGILCQSKVLFEIYLSYIKCLFTPYIIVLLEYLFILILFIVILIPFFYSLFKYIYALS